MNEVEINPGLRAYLQFQSEKTNSLKRGMVHFHRDLLAQIILGGGSRFQRTIVPVSWAAAPAAKDDPSQLDNQYKRVLKISSPIQQFIPRYQLIRT